MSTEELYVGREQTRVKHFIVQKYLERFAHIVGARWDTLTSDLLICAIFV